MLYIRISYRHLPYSLSVTASGLVLLYVLFTAPDVEVLRWYERMLFSSLLYHVLLTAPDVKVFFRYEKMLFSSVDTSTERRTLLGITDESES